MTETTTWQPQIPSTEVPLEGNDGTGSETLSLVGDQASSAPAECENINRENCNDALVPNEDANLRSINLKEIQEQLESGKKVLIDDAIKFGMVVTFVTEWNRDINKKHVSELAANAKNVKSFIQPICCMYADEYFAQYPDRVVEDAQGNKYGNDSAKVISHEVLVILDGQHRFSAEQSLKKQDPTYTPTLRVELVPMADGMKADTWVITMNTHNTNWNSSDRGKFIAASVKDSGETNISVAREWQKKYGIGERNAYMILTFQDCYKKKLQENYMNNPVDGLPVVLKGSDENIKRGKRTMEAFVVGFRNHPKLIKNMAAIKMLATIYLNANHSEQLDTLNDLLLFFKTIDANKYIKLDDMEAASQEKEIEQLTFAWDKFSHELETPEHRAHYEVVAEEAVQEYNTPKAAVKRRKTNSKKKK